MPGLFEPVQRMAALTDSVIVFFSGGKDSVATLDLAFRHFKGGVHAVFMYYVPGLSFQETTLQWAERHYGCEVYRIPHFELSHMLRRGVFCTPDPRVRPVKMNDVYAHVRDVFDCRWIVAGERCSDSIVRNAMIKKSGDIDSARGRFYPLAWWKKSDVLAYIKQYKLKVSPESAILKHSFGGLDPRDLVLLKKHYPEDYAKVLASFPLAEAGVVRLEREVVNA